MLMNHAMPLLGQAPIRGGVALSASASVQFSNPNPTLFSNRRSKFFPITKRCLNSLTVVANADAGGGAPPATTDKSNPPFNSDKSVSFVGQESVPLEGVIQFDKPNSSSLINKWGRVALLAGGDVLALLLFSAIGRFSHGFSVFDTETLRTADPFVAGWFLGAYFLGGFGEDGRGMNGFSKAVIAAAKSWSVGIPVGMTIRAATIGHIPPPNFILVTMGSTAFLLIGWRALLSSILPSDKSKKDDDYRRGSPFELFELLTSLIRRW
ncbi:uncharacterized protein LOC132274041 isoform X1 [Cornus florida]|uniref:uncharacterized protein LOC132274041 isoform X1 n=1 Tax=Cornus florida TaxID=4283 RepID=UPI00289D0E7A|nr:uncharacterized protein LOC132274041 isoform X1 [Cornus florida]